MVHDKIILSPRKTRNYNNEGTGTLIIQDTLNLIVSPQKIQDTLIIQNPMHWHIYLIMAFIKLIAVMNGNRAHRTDQYCVSPRLHSGLC